MMYARCNGCGETLGALMCLALMSDAGARCSPSPTYCPSTENHEHDFTANPGVHPSPDASAGVGGATRCSRFK